MSSSCQLSPADSAFSSMLSAFIGSVLNGLFSGFQIAFITGWISMLACIRILAAGCFEFFLTFKAGLNFQDNDKNYSYQGIENMVHAEVQDAIGGDEEHQLMPPGTQPQDAPRTSNASVAQQKLARRWFKLPTRTVDVFGWLGWSWSAIYTPISQSIWLGTNIADGRGSLLIVRALAIAVSALSLTFDYKQRYAAHLGRKWGSWAFLAFNVWTSTVCLLLGIESAVLLIVGATRLDDVPFPVFIIYPIFSIIWAAGSWKILPPIDASRPGVNIVFDVLMGAFAGLFVAAPAFALWRSGKFDSDVDRMRGSTSSSEGLSLGEFLSCQGASFWEKFAAIMP